MNYTLDQISEIVGGRVVESTENNSGAQRKELLLNNIITDSRARVAMAHNSVFLAINGSTHDGHRYVGEMIERGVLNFIVDHGEGVIESSMLDKGARFLVVDDSIKAIQKLAKHHRLQFKGKVLAITGSNGKTVVKEWIWQLWNNENGKIFRSPRSYNSQLGVALSLLMMEGDERLAIIEAGISEHGEMSRLEQMIKPDIGLITNIGVAHDENFSSRVDKLCEKFELFKHAGVIIYNSDDKLLSSVFATGGACQPCDDKPMVSSLSASRSVNHEISEADDFLSSLSFADKVKADGLSQAINVMLDSGVQFIPFSVSDLSNLSGDSENVDSFINPSHNSLHQSNDANSIVCRAVDHNNLGVRGSRSAQENIAAVLKFYEVLKLDHKSINVLSDVAMRLELQQGVYGAIIIDDTYNSDLLSLKIALDYQDNLTPPGGNKGQGRKALILSDIHQSGLNSADLYLSISQMVLDYNITNFVGIGKDIIRYKDLFNSGKFYATTSEFLESMREVEFAGQRVLVKGSREFEFEKITSRLVLKSHTSTLRIDLGAMAYNLNYSRAMLAQGVKTIAMVKANSYGSGDIEVASMLQFQKVDYLAVAFADEGVILRSKGGIKLPIIVLNADPSSYDTMIEHELEPEIYSISSLNGFVDQLTRYGCQEPQSIHIKLDTGMHRLGFMENQLNDLILRLSELGSRVRVASVFSHLSASEDPMQDDFTRGQISCFERMYSRISEGLGYRPLRHICNSAAIARFPQAHFDMVRLGIGLYGLGSEAERPVGVLETRIVQIKHLDCGQTVGYGRHGVVGEGGMTVAIVPVGYADGLDRRLGRGAWSMSVADVLCPIVGNICMDTCMIDISAVADVVAEGARVEIFGSNVPVRAMADVLGTIPYEIITSISSRIKRVYENEL